MKIEIDISRWGGLCKDFPNFNISEYTGPKERLMMFIDGQFNPQNLTGDMQRAWQVYHVIKEFQKNGVGLEIGGGQSPIEPFVVNLDCYYGENHPEYGGRYMPHIIGRGDVYNKPNSSFKTEHTFLQYPLQTFGSNTIGFLTSFHSLEHMENTLETLKEWIRIVKPGGALIMVMPDKTYTQYLAPQFQDKGHKHEYTPQEFKEILDKLVDLVTIEEFDTFKNNFSFPVLLRKK